MYPEKDYEKSRSQISQLVIKLELDGYILKKRIGKYAYVCLKQDKRKYFQIKPTKKAKKSKNSNKKEDVNQEELD